MIKSVNQGRDLNNDTRFLFRFTMEKSWFLQLQILYCVKWNLLNDFIKYMHVNVVWITINKQPFVDYSCCVRQFNMSFGSKNSGQNIKIAKKSQQFMCLKYLIKRITHSLWLNSTFIRPVAFFLFPCLIQHLLFNKNYFFKLNPLAIFYLFTVEI